MKFKSVIAALVAAGIAVSVAHGGSTVNPNIPALNSPLNSPPIQQNFQATFTDISNILGKFASTTAPSNPTAFQEWANTSTAPVAVFNYWNAGTATWIPFATLNTATGVYSSFSTSAGFLASAPVTVSVASGNVTYGLAKDGNFATVGGNLAFAPIANGSLLARCTGASGEPTACTWPTFAAQAIGATNGIFPHFVGGAWTTDTTGTSGHAVPFLDGINTFAALQTIYPGTATLRTALAGTLFRVAQLDGTGSVAQQDSFGAAGAFSCMRSDGTAAVSTALAANDLICGFGSHGYDGAANSTVAGAFRLSASQGWTRTAHGTYARIATSANGTITPVDQFGVEQDGGITSPPTVTGGSKGAGTINDSGGYFINGAPFNFSNLAGQASLAQLPTIGSDTVLGSIAGGTPIALSQAQLTSLINPATASLAGAVPAWPNNTTTFFRGDGSYSGLNLAALPAGTQDTILGYFGSTSVSAIAPGNCSNALTYSTTTHAFGCNTTAGTGNVTTSGSPVAGQAAVFSGSTAIAGVQSCLNIVAFGGNGNGTTANDTAFAAAFAALGTTGGCIYFPGGNGIGKYSFTSQIAETLPNSQFSIEIVGDGSNATTLFWPNASGGIQLTASTPHNSFHIRDLTVTTAQVGSGNGIKVIGAGQSPSAVTSDITNVNVTGDDVQSSGSTSADFWTTAVYIHNWSLININGLNTSGPRQAAGGAGGGVGLQIEGDTPTSSFALVINISQSNFNFHATGTQLGSFWQGVTFNQCNWQGQVGTSGINVPASGAGALVYLAVFNSQFNTGGNQILMSTTVADFILSGSVITVVQNSHIGVQGAPSGALIDQFTITGNLFNTAGSPTGTIAIESAGVQGTIIGNSFTNYATAVLLTAASANTNVALNVYSGGGTQVTNSGTAGTNNVGVITK